MQSVAGSVLQDDISSQFIQLNDSVRLGNTIMIHFEDQQDVQHSRNWHPRQQQRHNEGRRHRHALRPWDEDYVHALRGPVIYLSSAATGRTVFATGSTRPLGRDTVDETYLSHEYMMCIVCRNRPVDAQLQPCCHTIYCHECAVSQPFCRMCGQLVEDFIIQ
ncbi:uncharacterized protein LOC132563640 [Ylistrum balloti]|uniref:uncharacterized protein LOC132563640 n=1 Tax=Ylistrum balloti TaxID=509963 RepID=UPI002905D0D1|nr:uncharacterized protein LOC132563640 [Ylistrum balloti]